MAITATLCGWSPAVLAIEPRVITETARSQIASLLEEKASWTPMQSKLESQLIHALKQHRGKAFAPGAPRLQMDVKMRSDGRVLVDVKGRVTAQLIELITTHGGQIINSSAKFSTLRALIPVSELETLAGSADVVFIRRAVEAYHNTGSVDSEGDVTHAAVTARSKFAVTGAGVKVGVLSDSVDFLAESQASGDLGNVNVLPGQDGTPMTGEGTAMLEIIHDLAPDAELYFATAEGGEAVFAQNILDLRANGCDIIVDDVEYFNESPFQDGMVAQAVDSVTADGALYFSSANNSGNLDSGTAGVWEGDFVDGGPAAWPISGGGRVHLFGNSTYTTVLEGGSSMHVDLFWSDPLGGSSNDYDVFVLDSTGSSVLRSSITRQTGFQDPYEFISTLNAGERIVIVKHSGAARFLHLDTGRGRLSLCTSGATRGHSSCENALSVAAVDVATAIPGAFTGGYANPVETFSSDGPRQVFYNADGTAITPGDFSSTGGAIRQKPDIAAADRVSTSLSDFRPFPGTSAAAPHAAAIAALLKSYNPALTALQIRALLTNSALDIMGLGTDRNSGAGIVMADSALQAAPPDGLLITPGNGFDAGGKSGGTFNMTSLVFTLTNIGSSALDWTLVNTSRWLNLWPASGTLAPGGLARSVTVNLSGTSSTLTSGVYSATVVFTNVSSGLAQSREFNLSVSGEGPTPGTYSDTVLSFGPVGYWNLNETNPAAQADVTADAGSLGAIGDGFGFDNPVQGEPGIIGTSFRFSNPALTVTYLGSRVDIPYHPMLNPNGPFTVEFWMMPAQLTTDLFSPACSLDASLNSGASRSGWLFYQTNNLMQFRVGGLGGYAATASAGNVEPNIWQHIVGVYDGANILLYINGQKAAGPVPATGSSGFTPNTSVPLRLGATTIPNRTFDGWVDEAAFYARALTAAEIAAHHDAASTNAAGYGSQILASGPVGYWHLDEPPYTAPPPSTFPVATNYGTLAPLGNGFYEPGTYPGIVGVPGTAFGSDNRACQFKGTGYIQVPGAYFDFLGPLTLSAWVNANPRDGNFQTIVGRGVASYQLAVDGAGYLHFTDGAQPAGDLVSPGPIDDNQWHLLVGTYDGMASQALYIDGKLVTTVNNATTPLQPSSNEVWIGGNPDGGPFQFFKGTVDEVAIFTNALTAAQVSQLFASSTNTVSRAPPVFTGIHQVGGMVALSWTSMPGRLYRIEFKAHLVQSSWNTLTSLQATNSVMTISDPIGPNTQRYYRAVLLP
jgi:hypothetical protein